MSENESETDAGTATGVGDDQLPADLVPGHDNPLAEPLESGEDAGDLLHDGKHPDGAETDTDGDAGGDTGADG